MIAIFQRKTCDPCDSAFLVSNQMSKKFVVKEKRKYMLTWNTSWSKCVNGIFM